VIIGVIEALLFYCVAGKHYRQVEKDLNVESSASLARNNIDSLDYDSVSNAEASIEVPKATASCTEDLEFLAERGERTRLKVLKIMIWVDFVSRYALPISFTMYLIIIFGTNHKREDVEHNDWVYKDL